MEAKQKISEKRGWVLRLFSGWLPASAAARSSLGTTEKDAVATQGTPETLETYNTNSIPDICCSHKLPSSLLLIPRKSFVLLLLFGVSAMFWRT